MDTNLSTIQRLDNMDSIVCSEMAGQAPAPSTAYSVPSNLADHSPIAAS